MQIKFHLNRLETILKKDFHEIKVEIYYSRRRKLVHFAFDKPIYDYSRHEDFLKEIDRFYNRYFKRDFQLIKPIRVIHTIKWKYDYVAFRKRNSTS